MGNKADKELIMKMVRELAGDELDGHQAKLVELISEGLDILASNPDTVHIVRIKDEIQTVRYDGKEALQSARMIAGWLHVQDEEDVQVIEMTVH